MRLELRKAFVKDIQWGDTTKLENNVLYVNMEEAKASVLDDENFVDVDLDLARPGESVRIIPVKDAIEPRIKLEGGESFFPGFFAPMEPVGEGATLVLKGAAVITCGPLVGIQEGFIDMSGPAAPYNPFSGTYNLVMVAKPVDNLEKHAYERSLRDAGLKLSIYLAEKCMDAKIDDVEVYEKGTIPEENEKYPDLPKITYFCMSITQGLLHDTFLYAADMKNIVPTMVHPNEILDGAMVSGNCVSACDKNTTYHHVNDPIVLELYKRHGKEINFLGVIPTLESTVLAGKQRSTWMNAMLAKMMGADGVVISEEGYGNPDTDLCMNAKKCEDMGIKTVVISDEAAGEDGSSQGLADATPEMNGFVSAGNVNEMIEVPPMDKVIGYEESIAYVSGGAVESLREDGSMYVELQSIIGSTNELGFSKLGCEWV
ncbi:MAG: glycine/sarcosine/betaine reductase component B subunit [Synergistales bacterium]|nr:glycine/sarcosine/betaine reductase component B subunit [Synergistales bacterium]